VHVFNVADRGAHHLGGHENTATTTDSLRRFSSRLALRHNISMAPVHRSRTAPFLHVPRTFFCATHVVVVPGASPHLFFFVAAIWRLADVKSHTFSTLISFVATTKPFHRGFVHVDVIGTFFRHAQRILLWRLL